MESNDNEKKNDDVNGSIEELQKGSMGLHNNTRVSREENGEEN